jgi:hypothetical protein
MTSTHDGLLGGEAKGACAVAGRLAPLPRWHVSAPCGGPPSSGGATADLGRYGGWARGWRARPAGPTRVVTCPPSRPASCEPARRPVAFPVSPTRTRVRRERAAERKDIEMWFHLAHIVTGSWAGANAAISPARRIAPFRTGLRRSSKWLGRNARGMRAARCLDPRAWSHAPVARAPVQSAKTPPWPACARQRGLVRACMAA